MKWQIMRPDPKQRATDWHVVQVVRSGEDDDENDDIEIIPFHPVHCPVSLIYDPGVTSFQGYELAPPHFRQEYTCGLTYEVENNGWSTYFGSEVPKSGWYRVKATLVECGGLFDSVEYDVDVECVKMEDSE